MTEHLYINAHCSIVNNVVAKNSKVIFENKGTGVQPFLLSVYQHLAVHYPRFYKMDNLCKLGWLAAEVLLEGSFNKALYQPEDTGLILANKNSSLDADIRYYETVKTMASPALFVYTLPNIVLGEICIRHNFKGENDFFIFEAFDAGFFERYVRHLFTTDAFKACICGWADIVGDQYRANLLLVEETAGEQAVLFTEETIHQLYQTTHG